MLLIMSILVLLFLFLLWGVADITGVHVVYRYNHYIVSVNSVRAGRLKMAGLVLMK